MGHDRKRQTPVEGMHAYLGMYGQKFKVKGQRSKVKGTCITGNPIPFAVYRRPKEQSKSQVIRIMRFSHKLKPYVVEWSSISMAKTFKPASCPQPSQAWALPWAETHPQSQTPRTPCSPLSSLHRDPAQHACNAVTGASP